MTTAEAGPGTWEGAGVFSSYADLNSALAQDRADPLQIAYTAAGAGLDTLGTVADPVGSLFAAGIGWLIEHVDFLREPLDALAGDPGAVIAQARAWQDAAAELQATAVGYRQAAGAVSGGWDGTAADAYAQAVHRCTEGMERTAQDAERLSGLVLTTGAAVGTVRALIRDTIAQFLANVAKWVLAALAAATVTAGFSFAALVAAVVDQAVSLARTFVRRISRLLDLLDEAGTTAARLGEAMRDTAAQLAAAGRQTAGTIRTTLADPAVTAMSGRIDAAAAGAVDLAVGPQVRAGAEALDRAAGEARAAAVVEAGKQTTDAEQKVAGGGA